MRQFTTSTGRETPESTLLVDHTEFETAPFFASAQDDSRIIITVVDYKLTYAMIRRPMARLGAISPKGRAHYACALLY